MTEKKIIIKQAVIFAGGRGTRLKPLTDKTPKPMIKLNNKPFLEYLINLLNANKIKNVLILSGYLSEKISDYFGDGSNFGVNIKYSVGNMSWETGKRIKEAEKLIDEHFLLLYCDNYWPMNLHEMKLFYETQKKLGIVTVYTNKDHSTKNNMHIDSRESIDIYDRTRTSNKTNVVDIGFFILDKKIIRSMTHENYSFEEKIIPKLIRNKQISGFSTNHKYYSIGNIVRIKDTGDFLKFRKTVILDRDGVLNAKPKKGEYVKKWKEFKWLPYAKKAIALLKKADYTVLVATNQAGIARDTMTIQDLEKIHRKIQKDLKKKDSSIDKFYYCPHDWNEKCDCRKPEAGMLYQAQKDFNLDLTKTYFIGDDERDKSTAQKAKCIFLKITPGKNLYHLVTKIILAKSGN